MSKNETKSKMLNRLEKRMLRGASGWLCQWKGMGRCVPNTSLCGTLQTLFVDLPKHTFTSMTLCSAFGMDRSKNDITLYVNSLSAESSTGCLILHSGIVKRPPL